MARFVRAFRRCGLDLAKCRRNNGANPWGNGLGLVSAASSAGEQGNWCFRRFFSVRRVAEMENGVLEALRTVKLKVGDGRDVVTAGLIKNLVVDADHGTVQFSLVSGDMVGRELCQKAIMDASLDWLRKKPKIDSRPMNRTGMSINRKHLADGLEDVKHIIAVSSCKGGVGKSTVAVNLACALAHSSEKSRVGILDADIYGPSLPTMMVSPKEAWSVTRTRDKKLIKPLYLHGMKCMSHGFIAPGTAGTGESDTLENAVATVLRGPIVSKMIAQMALQTAWGDLDYLVIDMPPGTGDISLTLGQHVRIDGAVIVTTPQKLAFTDVVKGVKMFRSLKVPTLALVENMAWFMGDHKKYFPFGHGNADKFAETLQLPLSSTFSLPILESLSSSGDSGSPFFLHPKASGEVREEYLRLAACVRESLRAKPVEIVMKVDRNTDKPNQARPITSASLTFDQVSGLIIGKFYGDDYSEIYKIRPVEIRNRLRAVESMLGTTQVEDTVFPVSIEPVGNYAVSIDWSDGHNASIYTFEDLRTVCRATEEASSEVE